MYLCIYIYMYVYIYITLQSIYTIYICVYIIHMQYIICIFIFLSWGGEDACCYLYLSFVDIYSLMIVVVGCFFLLSWPCCWCCWPLFLLVFGLFVAIYVNYISARSHWCHCCRNHHPRNCGLSFGWVGLFNRLHLSHPF